MSALREVGFYLAVAWCFAAYVALFGFGVWIVATWDLARPGKKKKQRFFGSLFQKAGTKKCQRSKRRPVG